MRRCGGIKHARIEGREILSNKEEISSTIIQCSIILIRPDFSYLMVIAILFI